MSQLQQTCALAFNAAQMSCASDFSEYEASFYEICCYLKENEKALSWRRKNMIVDFNSRQFLMLLAEKYLSGLARIDFPKMPTTVPDEVVSVVMETAFEYQVSDLERIKLEHQHSMASENCVGALLERYINSKLKSSRWIWCAGDFVKATDFLRKVDEGWQVIQIKNRSNSENSSSSAIRQGTKIEKWYRTHAYTGETNWSALPESMKGHDLAELGFNDFVRQYLRDNSPSENTSFTSTFW